jgi:DNA-directed RNA polymerase subunit beta'
MTPGVTTVGRLMFNQSLPPEYRDEGREIKHKKDLSELLLRIAKEAPDKYVDALKGINDVARNVVFDYGRTASFSLSGLALPPEIKKLRDTYKAQIHLIKEDPKLDAEQKNKAIIDYLMPKISELQKKLTELPDEDNGFIQQVKTGARGNASQLMQILFGDMIVEDHKERPIPVPGLHGYGEGVTPVEMWAGSYGSRKGYIGVQLATSDAGYFGKQLTQVAHRVVVTEDDCGANDVGLTVPGGDTNNVGSVLAVGAGDLKAGHVLTKQDLHKLDDKEITVRSAVTCQAREGICSKCAGIREKGHFPHKGDAVGVTASRAIAEPLTQAMLSSKHTGGVAGKEKHMSAFKSVNQFIQVPEAFIGAAPLAKRDGKISAIDKAPQGGHYVHIGEEEHYVPEDQELNVKVNQEVEAGDALSDGLPNPAEIVKYKGIGEGRRYFTQKYYDILKENNVGNHRRNVEAIARAFINRVKITHPDGYAGHFPGDVVSYDDFVRDYEPREGYELTSPSRAVNQYLEKPMMHYSIGTRITPSIAKKMESAKIKMILAHKEEPVFEPVVSRAQDVSINDKDWMTRLGGFNLKKGMVDAASRGSTSQLGGSSFIPSVVSGTGLYSDIIDDEEE